MGCLIDIMGPRGVIDMGIRRYASIADAWDTRRRRKHRVEILNTLEEKLQLQRCKRSGAEDVVLWRGKGDVFKKNFSTRDT